MRRICVLSPMVAAWRRLASRSGLEFARLVPWTVGKDCRLCLAPIAFCDPRNLA
jgi:hypothetical protein